MIRNCFKFAWAGYKTSLRFLLLSLATGLLLSSFTACSNGSSDSSETIKSVYYASSGLSDYTQRALDAVPKVKSDGSTVPDIIVVKASGNLPEKDLKLILRAVSEGKTLIIDAPSAKEIQEFGSKIETLLGIERLLNFSIQTKPLGIRAMLHDVKALGEQNKKFEAVAVRDSKVYYVHNIEEVAVIEQSTKDDSATAVKPEGAIDERDSKNPQDNSSKADYSLLKTASIVRFSRWLRGLTPERSLESAAFDQVNADRSARSALEDAQKAQTFYHNFTAKFSTALREHYDGRYEGRCENVEVTTDVWTACELDTGTEFYLVRNSMTCNNQELNWTDDWDSGFYVAPYFENSTIQTKIEGTNLRSGDCSPQTSQGSTSYSSGTTVNLSGNIGLAMSGPQASVGGGLSWSESTTRSIPDISIGFYPKADRSAAEWEFTTPELRGHGDDSGSDISFDKPKEIQIRAAVFDTYALFVKTTDKDNTDATIQVETYCTTKITIKTAWKNKHKIAGITVSADCEWKTYDERAIQTFTDSILKPCNVKRQYIMGFTPPSGVSPADQDRLYAIVKEYISDWNSVTDYYAVGTGNLDNEAAKRFDAAMQTIETNKNVFHDRGFSGKFTFYIQNKESGTQPKTKEIEF